MREACISAVALCVMSTFSRSAPASMIERTDPGSPNPEAQISGVKPVG